MRLLTLTRMSLTLAVLTALMIGTSERLYAQSGKRQNKKPSMTAKTKKPPKPISPDAALIKAVKASEWFNVPLLLDKGASPNAKDADGKTALILAVLAKPAGLGEDEVNTVKPGEPALLGVLLQRGADVNGRDKTGGTALHAAATTGNTDMMLRLLAAKANINAQDNNGTTPLMLASLMRDGAAVKFLLDKGADINAKDKNGSTALIFSIVNSEVSILGGLLSSLGKEEPFTILLDKGADIQLEGSQYTPLIAAAMGGELEKVQILLERGAKPNAVGKDGITALMAATVKGKARIVKYLLENKADPNLTTTDGTTALILAVEMGSYASVEQLLKHGAKADYRHPSGMTAMKAAQGKKLTALINLLKQAGAME
jgi:uncharacterized protein